MNGMLLVDEDPRGRSRLAALRFYGVNHDSSALEKEEMRELAIRDGRCAGREAAAFMTYYDGDVDALPLGPVVSLTVNSTRLFRGRYMDHLGAPVAEMESRFDGSR